VRYPDVGGSRQDDALIHWCRIQEESNLLAVAVLLLYILCNILDSDFMPSISNPISLWKVGGGGG
jgi:hypothetical protein